MRTDATVLEIQRLRSVNAALKDTVAELQKALKDTARQQAQEQPVIVSQITRH